MLVIYNVIYAKPTWAKEEALTHLTDNGVSDVLGCEENDTALCFTLLEKPKDDTSSSRALPITESVCLIVKDLKIKDADQIGTTPSEVVMTKVEASETV
jgi:hypothetical protein